MRGVRKPWPPLNVRRGDEESQRFVDAEKEYLADLPGRADKAAFARSEFDRLHKTKLRDVMYEEQKSLCVYCERSLSETGTSRAARPHIEHWRPRSQDPDHALHWPNLYLSCSTNDRCGHHKGARRLANEDKDPDLPWPTDLEYERLLGFTAQGDMYVREDIPISDATRHALELAIDGDRTRRAILNLNDPKLTAARRAALDEERTRLERDHHGQTASRDDRSARADRLLHQRPRPEFVSIRVAWLTKMLGRGA